MPFNLATVRDHVRRLIKHTSIAAVAVAVIGYWYTYQDRIDASEEQAWRVLGAALQWDPKTATDPLREYVYVRSVNSEPLVNKRRSLTANPAHESVVVEACFHTK